MEIGSSLPASLLGVLVATQSMAAPASIPSFYTRAETFAGSGVDADTGATNSPIANSINPVTTVYYCPPPFCRATGDSVASSDLVHGALHGRGGLISADPTAVPAFGESTYAALGDTLFFSNPGASATTTTAVSFRIHVDGTISRLGGTEGATLSVGVGRALESGDWTPLSNGVASPYNTTDSWPASISEDIAGSFGFLGPSATVPLEMILQTHAQYGYVDFGDTARVSFDPLPAGVTLTSASGFFLTASTVPEPASATLLGVGVACLGWLRQRLHARGKRT